MSDLADSLVGAVARREIVAWFQPQIDVATGAIVAAEALCRWQRPDHASIPPSVFIPLAEASGAILEIGRFMAEQAVAAIAQWSIDVSVNVSPVQLRTAAFTSWIERHLARVKLRERTLTLEITEGHPLLDFAALSRRLDRLRAFGLGIAIDDFGAGQASLTQLRRLHATELKIDRSLVVDGALQTLADAVSAAHDAGARVVAEGVETAEQLDRVRRLGCDRAQGYFIGRPMPKPQLDALLAA